MSECPAGRSVSETDITQIETEHITPDNSFIRYKRKRSEENTLDLHNFKEEIKLLLSNQEHELKKYLPKFKAQTITFSLLLPSSQNKIQNLKIKLENWKRRYKRMENIYQF